MNVVTSPEPCRGKQLLESYFFQCHFNFDCDFCRKNSDTEFSPNPSLDFSRSNSRGSRDAEVRTYGSGVRLGNGPPGLGYSMLQPSVRAKIAVD